MNSIAVHTLPHRLYHVSLAKEKLHEAAYAIINMFLFPKGNDWFFNYTATYEEISMIVSDKSPLFEGAREGDGTHFFPRHSLKIVGSPWRALAIYGTCAQQGLISELSFILAKAGISIYYLSTGNNDYILVQEEELSLALASLKEHYSVTIETSNSNNSNSSNPLIDFSKLEQEIIDLPKCSLHREMFKKAPNSILECTILNEELYICSMHKESRSESAQALLRLIFFSKSDFFSFTETDDEISLMIEQKEMLQGGLTFDVISDPWGSIQRWNKSSLCEVGVISYLSKPITSAQIPIVYLSTFNSAFIFVQSKYFNLAKMVLENAGFKIGTLEDRLRQQTPPPPTTNTNNTGDSIDQSTSSTAHNLQDHDPTSPRNKPTSTSSQLHNPPAIPKEDQSNPSSQAVHSPRNSQARTNYHPYFQIANNIVGVSSQKSF